MKELTEWWKIQSQYLGAWSSVYSRRTFKTKAEANCALEVEKARNSEAVKRIVKVTVESP